MPLRPIVARSGLAKHEIIGTEQLTKRPRTNTVHRARLQIQQNRPRHIAPSRRLVVIHVDPLQLRSLSPWYDPVGSTPCSSLITSQNLAPIWFPHCPAWMWQISRILRPNLLPNANVNVNVNVLLVAAHKGGAIQR